VIVCLVTFTELTHLAQKQFVARALAAKLVLSMDNIVDSKDRDALRKSMRMLLLILLKSY
jgi:hypothetical protein